MTTQPAQTTEARRASVREYAQGFIGVLVVAALAFGVIGAVRERADSLVAAAITAVLGVVLITLAIASAVSDIVTRSRAPKGADK